MKQKIYIPSCDFLYEGKLYSFLNDRSGTETKLTLSKPSRTLVKTLMFAINGPQVSWYEYSQRDNSAELVLWTKETKTFISNRDKMSNFELEITYPSLEGVYNILNVSFEMNNIYSILELKRK